MENLTLKNENVHLKLNADKGKIEFKKVIDKLSSEQTKQLNNWITEYVELFRQQKTDICIKNWNLELSGNDHILPLKKVISNCECNITIEKVPELYQPTIIADKQSGILSFADEAYSYYANEYLDIIFCWLQDYLANHPRITFNFKIVYISFSYAEKIKNILEILDQYAKHGGKALINWYYPSDDTELKELGEELQEVINIPFNFSILDDFT